MVFLNSVLGMLATPKIFLCVFQSNYMARSYVKSPNLQSDINLGYRVSFFKRFIFFICCGVHFRIHAENGAKNFPVSAFENI